MAHLVESMFSGSGITPWHALGNVLPERLTAAEAIQAANLDWQVDLVPLYPELPGEPGHASKTPVRCALATVRNTDRSVLGVVGKRYRPLQNHEAFGFLDAVVTRKEAVYETAGSLDGGRCIWLLARLPGDVVVKVGRYRDPINKYLLLSNRHDGFGSVTIKMTPVRVVCANTLAIALKGDGVQIRHTQAVADRVRTAVTEQLGFTSNLAEDLMARTRQLYANFGEAANMMARIKMTDEATRAYLRRCLAQSDIVTEEEAHVGKEKRSSRLFDCALELVECGRGANMTRGTAWGSYQAITELVDHHMGYRTSDARLRNVGFDGNGHRLKLRALEEALKLGRL